VTSVKLIQSNNDLFVEDNHDVNHALKCYYNTKMMTKNTSDNYVPRSTPPPCPINDMKRS